MKLYSVLLLFCLVLCQNLFAQPVWAEFEPGKISNGNIYRGCFTVNNEAFYFFRKTDKPGEDYRIFVSRKGIQGWSEPEQVSIGAKEHSDLYPAISSDGKHAYFTSYRPVQGGSSAEHANIWRAAIIDYKHWSEPELLGEISSVDHYESNLAVVGNRDLVFRRVSGDWTIKETYIARWNGETFSTPELYTPIMQWKDWNKSVRLEGGHPSADESMVLLTVRCKDDKTGQWLPSDQWITRKINNSWTDPIPLGGGINTKEENENFSFFDAELQSVFVITDLKRVYRASLQRVILGN